MNRKLIFFLVGITYLAVIMYGLYSVYTVEATLRVSEPPSVKPDNRIAIARTELFGKLERPQVIFDHMKHEDALRKDGEGCEACHPTNDQKEIVFDFPKHVKGKDKIAIMNAYHDECIECHKQKSRENKVSGPITCAECHKKETANIKIPYPVAEFDFAHHDQHVRKLKEKIGKDDCSLCHHSYDLYEENEALRLVYEPGEEEACYYCHDITAKRGPEYAAITQVAANKGLDMRRASHQLCLNCHLKYQQEYVKKGEEAPPTECIKCHTGEYKTVAQLEKVPRPDRDQPKRLLISVKDAKMKGVPFDHDSHQRASKNCRSCHHETLKACKACHDLTGRPEGGYITVAQAYHDPLSEFSCQGCHNRQTTAKDCYGCHHLIPIAEIDSLGPKKESCEKCHSGETKSALTRPTISVSGLDPQKVPVKVKVDILQKEYEPSEFPHMDIIKELVDISNKSKLAQYFHKDLQTICDGCHHESRTEAEAKKDTPPNCRNCHPIVSDPKSLNRTTLLSAYHRQCLGCHEKMMLDKGQKCADCHKKKEDGPSEITSVKNENVVRQNKEVILNVWRPK